MKIVVLIKQVPDMEKVKFDSERGVIDRKSAGTEINPYDLNALEAAVSIGEACNAKVMALSMGPASAEESLKEAIARGADEAILLNDRKFGGADVKATATTLAAAIKKLGQVDLVITGLQTVDGDTGQVGSEIAQMLNIPSICDVTKILESSANNLSVETDLWDSIFIKETAYPALISVTKEANSPRLPTFQGKRKAKKTEIPVWTLADLREYITEEDAGIKGSATVVKKIVVPEAHKREGVIYKENLEEAINNFIIKAQTLKILEA